MAHRSSMSPIEPRSRHRLVHVVAAALSIVVSLLVGVRHTQALESIEGRCVAVLDGDSIRIVGPSAQIEIRLHGIDAPEHRQAFADRAKATLSDLVYGKTVEVARVTTDSYGRWVARVFVGDTDVNLEMVRRGLAWHYDRYSKDSALDAAEATARARRAGLWVDPSPVPPWSFRREARAAQQDGAQAERTQGSSSTTAADGEVHGNTSSRVFHRSSCPNYRCRNCTAVFPTAAAAQAAGFEPAGCCHPRSR